MANPVPGYSITTRFGVPGSWWASGFHTGIDIAAPVGTPVVAAMAGRVIHVGWGGWGRAYGIHVIIEGRGGKHQYGYMHLSSTSVRVGQRVKSGQRIGKVGATGNTTGPHLHFEVRVSPFGYNNRVVDPTGYCKEVHIYMSKLNPGVEDSDSVLEMQRVLNRRKKLSCPRTGRYGKSTQQVVATWQKRHGYKPTGDLNLKQAKELFRSSKYVIHRANGKVV